MTKNRRLRFTADQVSDALRAHDGIVSRAAEALGCSPVTIWSYIHRFKSVEAALDEARQLTLDVAENVVMESLLDGDVQTAKWILGTLLASDRGYAALTRRELTGAGGAPIAVDAKMQCVHIAPAWDLSKLTTEELEALMSMSERATGQTWETERTLITEGGCGKCEACLARAQKE